MQATAGDVAATLLRMPAAEALEAGGALKGWLDGQLARVAALTQQHPGVAASSDCGQGREMPEVGLGLGLGLDREVAGGPGLAGPSAPGPPNMQSLSPGLWP